jgi:trans-aconitate methyltransferase
VQLLQAVSLIQHSIPDQKTVWADLGCGEGLFTNALSQLLAAQSLIYAVDKNKHALKNVSVKSGIRLEKLAMDFINDDLQLNHLSGILMANAFHFVKDKNAFIHKVLTYLDLNGYFILVEYDTDVANAWVPYPISFTNLKKLFVQYNFATEKLGEIPSRFRGNIYSAIIHQ